MIHTYQQNPGQYLSQTACRRNLSGDVMSILCIHSFLEHWGLINFNIELDVCAPVPSDVTAQSANEVLNERFLRFKKRPKEQRKIASLQTKRVVYDFEKNKNVS